jgi:hypothetical protein
VRELLYGAEPVEVHLTTRVDTRWREIPTLTAQVDGSVEPEKFVLFSGHLDSWYHGAMDDGTASATIRFISSRILPLDLTASALDPLAGL